MMGIAELQDVKYIVIHCTGTKPSENTDARAIHRYHVNSVGYAMIGYHFLITTNGDIQTGRPLFLQGAHCKAGRMNHQSIGICYVGGVNEKGEFADTRTEKQKTALNVLLTVLRKLYPGVRVIGHRDVEPGKACPCFDAQKEYNH